MPRYYSSCALALLITTSMSFEAYARTDIIKKVYIKEKKRKKDVQKELIVDGEFGFLVASGNTNTSTVKTALSSEHELQNWSNRYFAEFLYKQNQSNDDSAERLVTAQKLLLSGQFDYKLNSDKNRLFTYLEYEDDRFSGFRYQTTVATGWSSTAWKNDASELRYSIGPGYSYSEFEIDNLDSEQDYQVLKEVIVRGSIDYRLKLSESSKFRQFFSVEAGQESTRARSETSLTANLIDRLAMKLSFVMIHNDSVTDDFEDLSTETSVSLVYQFF